MKKIVLLMLIFLVGCTKTGGTKETESPCKDNPLSADCFIPSKNLDHISPTPDEYLVDDNFEAERPGQMPRNFLLYENSEYRPGMVHAKVIKAEDNQYVELYSNGKGRPPYPQNAPTSTLIFTTKFNLDKTGKGALKIDMMVPSENNNEVHFGLSAGAVNVMNFIIKKDYSLHLKKGGPFFYYSGNNDGGEVVDLNKTITPDTWITFEIHFDVHENNLKAFIHADTVTLLHESTFHRSNRFNAKEDGEIFAPNNVKITMPAGIFEGFAYVDNVIVKRLED